ncbi:MAG: hypothetical protein VB957_19600 [Pseudomonadales bacterium]
MNALYRHDQQGHITATNEETCQPAPRFHLAKTEAGHVCRFRHDMPAQLAASLIELSSSEPKSLTNLPKHEQEYIRLLKDHGKIENVWSGPTYWIPEDTQSGIETSETTETIEITEKNASLLENGLHNWLPDIPHCRPLMTIVEDGQAVSICASVRTTALAHEAGLETLLAYRKQGHALSVVPAWANAVRTRGATPFYSTSWDNIASQRVAAKLNLKMYGVDFHVR